MKLGFLAIETRLKLTYYKITRWFMSWFCNHQYVPCANWRGTWSECKKCHNQASFMPWN